MIGRDTDGGFAEYLSVPASQLFRLPDSIDNRTAPLIQVATTCLHAQRQMPLFLGESVAVVGLGVSGQIHVQLAKARGAGTVIGISRSAYKNELARGFGANLTLEPGPALVQAVQEATSGRSATEAALPFYDLYYKEVTLINGRAAKPEDFAGMIGLLESGAVRLDALVTQCLPLEDLEPAVRMLEDRGERRLKIILDHT